MDVPLTSPYIVNLTDPDRQRLRARVRAATTAQRDVLRARIVLPPPTATRTPRSLVTWRSASTPCASGGARTAPMVSTGYQTGHGRDDDRCSPRSRLPG